MSAPRRRWISRFKWFAAFLAIWSIFGIAVLGGGWTPFYRVKQQYGLVITRVDGSREAKNETGIYFRFLSFNPGRWVFNTKEFSCRLEYIYLDNDPNPHEIQAADKIKFQGAGVWTFKVTDLRKYGIEMGDRAREMLTAELNGIAKARIQTNPVETIVTNIEKINQEINGCKDVAAIEVKYGIKIESFRMMHATYPKELNEKTAQAKGIKIMAEATEAAADHTANARKKLADADKYRLNQLIAGSGVATEDGRKKALETLRDINLYETLEKMPAGGVIYVIPHGSGPNLTLPSPPQTGSRLRNPQTSAPDKEASSYTYGVPPKESPSSEDTESGVLPSWYYGP